VIRFLSARFDPIWESQSHDSDDISKEGSYEFANMKATSNAETEFAMGREPTEMSRPATTSRAGVSSFYIYCVV
jgi:hypothetical protein